MSKGLSIFRRILAGINAVLALIYLYVVFFIDVGNYYPIGILVFLLGSFYMMNSAYKEGEKAVKEDLGPDFNKTLIITGMIVQVIAIILAIVYLLK